MRFKIADIQPNPFRHMDRYPIRRDKVTALRESLQATGFWDNVVARLDDEGKPQIAYGHHRLVALREEYKPGHQIDLIIRDLSDEDMLRIMARENMEEWGTSALVEHETVRAVVEAYAAGQIALAAPPAKTSANLIRYAPSFRLSDGRDARRDHPYTTQAIAEFLGWTEPSGRPQAKLGSALNALDLIDSGILRESDFTGLSTKDAQAVVSQAQAARKEREREARELAKQAERDRRQAEKAEAERAKQEQRARAARDEHERREAEHRQREAEDRRRRAEQRQREAEAEAKRQRKQAEGEARRTGRHVSGTLRRGEAGYRQAGSVAREVREKREQAPPQLDKGAMKLADRIGKILLSNTREAQELAEVVRWQVQLAPHARLALIDALRNVVSRADRFMDQLGHVEGDATEIISDDRLIAEEAQA